MNKCMYLCVFYTSCAVKYILMIIGKHYEKCILQHRLGCRYF